jgi:hypothetical protein
VGRRVTGSRIRQMATNIGSSRYDEIAVSMLQRDIRATQSGHEYNPFSGCIAVSVKHDRCLVRRSQKVGIASPSGFVVDTRSHNPLAEPHIIMPFPVTARVS